MSCLILISNAHLKAPGWTAFEPTGRPAGELATAEDEVGESGRAGATADDDMMGEVLVSRTEVRHAKVEVPCFKRHARTSDLA